MEHKTMAMNYLMVGIGGVFGAWARYFISTVIRYESFPYHTLIVNLVGCFLIGALSEFFVFKGHLPNELRLLLITGFLGAFTTFSAFALDTGLLVEKQEYLKSFVYIAASVVLGLAAYFASVALVRHLFKA